MIETKKRPGLCKLLNSFFFAAQRLDVPPSNCVVVEDAPAGIAAAHAASMKSVGLASTGRTAAELDDADLVIDSLHELSPDTFGTLLNVEDQPG